MAFGMVFKHNDAGSRLAISVIPVSALQTKERERRQ
jgi:hypothetical protein